MMHLLVTLIGGAHYSIIFFFFNDTATTEIYTLSLHDALPIFEALLAESEGYHMLLYENTTDMDYAVAATAWTKAVGDRKSTRLNSSHANISYAVFCLKKKKKNNRYIMRVKTHHIQCTATPVGT